jgi:hypothetical protein
MAESLDLSTGLLSGNHMFLEIREMRTRQLA